MVGDKPTSTREVAGQRLPIPLPCLSEGQQLPIPIAPCFSKAVTCVSIIPSLILPYFRHQNPSAAQQRKLAMLRPERAAADATGTGLKPPGSCSARRAPPAAPVRSRGRGHGGTGWLWSSAPRGHARPRLRACPGTGRGDAPCCHGTRRRRPRASSSLRPAP